MFNKFTGFLSVATLFLTQTNAQTNSTIIIENNPTGISTATILGGVAVAISSVGIIGSIIYYLYKGGTVSGLAKIAIDNREIIENIAENINKLPLDDLKKHLGVENDLKKLEEYKKQAEELYNKLPDSIKEKVKDNLTVENLIELVENPQKFQEKFQQKIKENISEKTSDMKVELFEHSKQIDDKQVVLFEHSKEAVDKLPVPNEMKSKIEYEVQNIIKKQLELSNSSSNEHIQIELKENPLESSVLSIKENNNNTIQSASINIIENKN